MKKFSMLEFVGREYRWWVNFLLWFFLIGLAVGGIILGCIIDGQLGSLSFYLFIAGAMIGCILDILLGGFIANFLTMVDRIEKIEKKLNENSQNTNKEGDPT